MMTWKRGIGAIAVAWALVHPGGASGQMAPAPDRPPGPAMPTASTMMNPYMNPYLNPYLNPAVTPQRMSPSNAALFMFQAQAANGGLGSGRLSNPRADAPARAATARARVAEMPDSVSRPGGGAARYFNPGPGNANGAGRYFNPPNRHFMNNRR